MQVTSKVAFPASRTVRGPELSFTSCLNQHAREEFVASSVEGKTQGLTFKEALALARPETDRATSADRLNPASDALLLNLIDKTPVDVGRMAWASVKRWITYGDGAPEKLQQSVANYKIGEQAPLDMQPLLQSLQAAMKEFPQFQPHIGAEHVWSPESQKGIGISFTTRAGMALKGERPFPTPVFGSKLISALGLGATAITMPTGTEDGLKSWMLEQKDGSVQFDQLFREAYRLNEGDLYGTLLSAENVLSEGLYTPDRQERAVTKKLSYLRSDSAPAGDNFGAWYHLLGAALYTLVRPEWKAAVAMKIEAAGSYILEGSDPQEDHINSQGIQLGKALRGIAEKGLDPSAQSQPYVNNREFAWDRRAVRNFSAA